MESRRLAVVGLVVIFSGAISSVVAKDVSIESLRSRCPELSAFEQAHGVPFFPDLVYALSDVSLPRARVIVSTRDANCKAVPPSSESVNELLRSFDQVLTSNEICAFAQFLADLYFCDVGIGCASSAEVLLRSPTAFIVRVRMRGAFGDRDIAVALAVDGRMLWSTYEIEGDW